MAAKTTEVKKEKREAMVPEPLRKELKEARTWVDDTQKSALMEKNLNLVEMLAKKVIREGYRGDLDLLKQRGYSGLGVAINRFKWGREPKSKFRTYARHWILAYMKGEVDVEFSTSLDDPIGEDGACLHEMVPSQETISEDTKLDISKMWSFIEQLPLQLRLVLKLRYLEPVETKTLEEVGGLMHYTRERIRQLEKEAISTLRQVMGVSA